LTKQVFVNSYPWLFPGGIGDLYDMKRGKWSVKEWGRHLLRYYDGRFINDQFFTMFVHNTIQRHDNNTQGNFFFKDDRFIGQNPPSIDTLKRKLAQGDIRYIQMLRYFARNIKGSDNYWRARTEDLQYWIQHHIARGRGPPTFFITLSCAEYWWPDLLRLLAQLERKADREGDATAIESGNSFVIKKSAKRYALYVNDFFMKRATKFLKTVLKDALGIEHYWARVEFAPGRGQIHLHLLAIARGRAYLDDFYKAQTMDEKAKVVETYAKQHLNMTANVRIKDDDPEYHADRKTSPLTRKFCECDHEPEDVRLLAQDCMCHHCNRFCLQTNKKNEPRTCRVGFGTESKFGYRDTPGMTRIPKSEIVKDDRGFWQFRMKRMASNRVVQHSRTLLQGWRANCDVKLLLYFSNPHLPDIGEIEEVIQYVVAYTGKRHRTSQEEKSAIQNIISR
jgi:hypothetical protein